MFDITFFAAIGFLFAAYAVVGNDALQTLGTFIASNSRLHWFWLFLFAAIILVVTFTYGWMINDGDPSYGRLANAKKYPAVDIQWYHTLPPLVLVIITRFGVPVSTSFMVLTVFATIGGLSSMLQKSLIGYGLAFAVGLGVFLIASNTLEKFFRKTEHQQHHPIWIVLQWLTTAYLWAVWLIQDFANIFVFLPRQLSAFESFTAMFAIVGLLAYTFANKGGPVQRILKTKTAVTDIRSATIIDFIYASLLFYFKELNNIPMSTTFVFLGLIAGREYGFALTQQAISFFRTCQIALSDIAKAYIGLVLSINMAVFLPFIAKGFAGAGFPLNEIVPTQAYATFIITANLLLIPVAVHLHRKTTGTMITLATLLSAATATFFLIPLS
ncbi:MAG: hypothetical protein DHS20C05_02650 [Hyphococcus sp.]|nr:MAG: hypothetical protein DHS20C05_02650 [Marinicaulis sp.]